MQNLNQTQSHAAYSSRVMEAETISKNAASPKSQTSRGRLDNIVTHVLKMKKAVAVLCVFMGMATMAQAQFSQFHAGFAFPSGKFADGDELDDIFERGKGFAGTGFIAGYKYYSPLSSENLSWVFGIEALYNGLNSDGKDKIDDMGFEDVTYPMYLNFPVTFGLNYAIPLQETLKLYGEAAIGANFSIPTEMSLSNSPNNLDRNFKFTSALGFAYCLEGGLFIKNKYSIGLRYNDLGSYKFKYKVDYGKESSEKGKFDKALSIVNISLCAGILF